jgi:hypothetical protein
MKNLLFLLLMIPVISFANDKQSADRESTKVSLYIPGILVKAGSWFVPKEKDAETKYTLKRIRSISLVIREGCAYDAYKSSKKYNKKMNKLQGQHFESLLVVKDEDTQASIFIRQNKKEKIRQVAVIADDGNESFVFARIRCNFTMSDVKNLMKNKELKEKLTCSKNN